MQAMATLEVKPYGPPGCNGFRLASQTARRSYPDPYL